MTKGIYCFIDEKTGIVVYIGRFSGRQRIKDHYSPSKYDQQQINRVLQNNPDRYRAEIICEYPDLTNDELNYFEIKEILKHKFLYDEIPRFNFTAGGEGTTGYKHTEETIQKIVASNTGQKRSEETRKNISESHKGLEPWNRGKKGCFSNEALKKMSDSHKGKNAGENNLQWKNYARITKSGHDKGKQVYRIRYKGKNLKSSVYIHKLYKWFAENYPDEYLYFEGV